MAQMSHRPEEQTGTGEARSTPEPTRAASADDPFRPPDVEEAVDDVNRSGSGGSGGPVEDDPHAERQGPRSLEDLLAGDP